MNYWKWAFLGIGGVSAVLGFLILVFVFIPLESFNVHAKPRQCVRTIKMDEHWCPQGDYMYYCYKPYVMMAIPCYNNSNSFVSREEEESPNPKLPVFHDKDLAVRYIESLKIPRLVQCYVTPNCESWALTYKNSKTSLFLATLLLATAIILFICITLWGCYNKA